MNEWLELVERVKYLKDEVTIAIVGKYVELHDAYLSVAEAIRHAGYYLDSKVSIRWINSEDITKLNVASKLKDIDGVVVPGGFGNRGIEGKIDTITYVRLNKIPFLGICLGMQLTCIEYARNVCGLKDANSIEFEELTKTPIITIMKEQIDMQNKGGTQRLGNYECTLLEGTKAKKAYGLTLIEERHRHRYEFNNMYKDKLTEKGLIISGVNRSRDLVEIVEIEDHPWFVASQFHPEFTSRPNRAHPLFQGLLNAAYKKKYNK